MTSPYAKRTSRRREVSNPPLARHGARPTFTVALRPEPEVVAPLRTLRTALKALLRNHGLRAVTIREDWPTPETGSPPESDGRRP